MANKEQRRSGARISVMRRDASGTRRRIRFQQWCRQLSNDDQTLQKTNKNSRQARQQEAKRINVTRVERAGAQRVLYGDAACHEMVCVIPTVPSVRQAAENIATGSVGRTGTVRGVIQVGGRVHNRQNVDDEERYKCQHVTYAARVLATLANECASRERTVTGIMAAKNTKVLTVLRSALTG